VALDVLNASFQNLMKISVKLLLNARQTGTAVLPATSPNTGIRTRFLSSRCPQHEDEKSFIVISKTADINPYKYKQRALFRVIL
jgi:hypothetical protein